MTHELIKRDTALALGVDVVRKEIAALQDKMDFIPDSENVESVISLAKQSRKLFTTIEKTRKAVKQAPLDESREIDNLSKELKLELSSFSQIFWDAKKDHDNAEKIKKEQFEALLQKKIDEISSKVDECFGKAAVEIEETLNWLLSLEIKDMYHREMEALKTRERAIECTKDLLEGARNKEIIAKMAKETAKRQAEPEQNQTSDIPPWLEQSSNDVKKIEGDFELMPWEEPPEELNCTEKLSKKIHTWFLSYGIELQAQHELIGLMNQSGIDVKAIIPEIDGSEVPY